MAPLLRAGLAPLSGQLVRWSIFLSSTPTPASCRSITWGRFPTFQLNRVNWPNIGLVLAVQSSYTSVQTTRKKTGSHMPAVIRGPNQQRRAELTLPLTSEQPFWVLVSLASFKAHFKKAQGFIVSMDVPPQWRGVFRRPDTSEPVQAADMAIVNAVRSAGNNGEEIRVRPVIKTDLGTRFLAKLGLAIGFKLLDAPFLSTEYTPHLRAGFREADQEKIKQIPVNGTGYLSGHGLNRSREGSSLARGVGPACQSDGRDFIC